jgi:hypothetical protein
MIFNQSKFLLFFLSSLLFFNWSGNIGNIVLSDNFQQTAIAQKDPQQIINQGKQVIINNKKVNLAWIQWEEGDKIRTGVSDMGAEAVLGIELLSSTNTNQQSIRWFTYQGTVPTKFINPYRYLDITDLMEKTSLQVKEQGNLISLDLPDTQVNKVYETNSSQGKKMVIELDKPSFFRVSQGNKQAVIIINGQYNQSSFPPLDKGSDPLNNSAIEEDEGDRIIGNDENVIKNSLFQVNSKEEETIVTINLPLGSNLKVTSANPSRLLVELSPSVVPAREIQWHDNILMSRKYVTLYKHPDPFLVSALTLNNQKNALELRPILPNSQTVIGTEPLKNIGNNLELLAGINGGFFNRKNQLPLGSIKDNNNWLSSPILNRGVIAWDNLGNFKIDRLKLEEVITINNRERLTNNYLNSGYVQKGIARYTSNWSNSYTTLSDQETIIVVENDKVRDKIVVNKVGEKSVKIPPKSYLLVLRKSPEIANKFKINDQVKLNTYTSPPELNKYPYIMGAGPLLVLNGQIVLNGEAENFTKAFNDQKASRSAIAVNKKGEVMLVAVHNRIGGPGPTLHEFARILLQMGAVSALNLDGGSSTQIYLGGEIIDRSAATAAKVNNGIGVFLKRRN